MNAAVMLKRGHDAHLVRSHRARPKLERRRIRALCGRGGTVVSEATRAIGICADCREIERILT